MWARKCDVNNYSTTAFKYQSLPTWCLPESIRVLQTLSLWHITVSSSSSTVVHQSTNMEVSADTLLFPYRSHFPPPVIYSSLLEKILALVFFSCGCVYLLILGFGFLCVCVFWGGVFVLWFYSCFCFCLFLFCFSVLFFVLNVLNVDVICYNLLITQSCKSHLWVGSVKYSFV